MSKSTRSASRVAAAAMAVIGAVVAVAMLAPPALAQDRGYLITGAEIERDTITSENLAPGSVGASELAPGAVWSSHVAAGQVGQREIGTSGVNFDEITTDAVRTEELAPGAVRTDDLAFAAVGANQMKWSLVQVVFDNVWLAPGRCYMKPWDVPDNPLLVFQPYFLHAEWNSQAQQNLPVTAFPTRRTGMPQIAVRICNMGLTHWSPPVGGAIVVVPYLKW